MKIAINLLCGTVKQTLGPKGNNVMIDSFKVSPYITNDGVTIAENIESDIKGVSTILEIAKEASIKTNEVVGDGTTSTLVLLESLFLNSLEYINHGIHPVLLKQELDKCLEEILNNLAKLKKKASKKMLRNIAHISANDKNIGDLAYEAFQIVSDVSAILIEENEENITKCSHLTGYYFASTLASNYFLQNQSKIEYQNANLLILKKELTNIESISRILNEVIEQQKPIIIIAENFDEYLTESIVSLVIDGKLKCCLLKLEEYGMNATAIKEDLASITGAKIIENESEIYLELGNISHIMIGQEYTRIDFQKNEKLEKYINQIKKRLKEEKEDYKKEFYKKRIAMFTNGIVKIHLSGRTKVECREKRMRLEDAICALSASKNGTVLGGGISLFQISNKLNEKNIGSLIWKKALEKPLEQILWNAGLEINPIKNQIVKNDFNFLYNVSTNQLESYKMTNVIDPYEVVASSLKHACSIATMLITTTSLVLNEKIENPNLENNIEL